MERRRIVTGRSGLCSRGLVLAGVIVAVTGCCGAGNVRLGSVASSTRIERSFEFARDTVGFTNETRWLYAFEGEEVSVLQRPHTPEFSLRCFSVARLNRQFFDHAAFEPEGSRLSDEEVRRRIREVVSRSARRPSRPEDRVRFPGYAGLRELSREHGAWMQEIGCGVAESYWQRGHWRMLFPFSRRHQERMAQKLAARLESGRPVIVHLVRFPQLTINHAVLVFEAVADEDGYDFLAADPNDPNRPWTLRFDRRERSFHWPRTRYFAGGPVDVYDVYRNAWY